MAYTQRHRYFELGVWATRMGKQLWLSNCKLVSTMRCMWTEFWYVADICILYPSFFWPLVFSEIYQVVHLKVAYICTTNVTHSGVEEIVVVKMVLLACTNTLKKLSGMNHIIKTTVCTYIIPLWQHNSMHIHNIITTVCTYIIPLWQHNSMHIHNTIMTTQQYAHT
jgi:hypothetical protein